MKSISVPEINYRKAGVTASQEAKLVASKNERPKMTRKLAEERAVGRAAHPKFDGTAFLTSLKK